jgi:hypothetical protein
VAATYGRFIHIYNQLCVKHSAPISLSTLLAANYQAGFFDFDRIEKVLIKTFFTNIIYSHPLDIPLFFSGTETINNSFSFIFAKAIFANIYTQLVNMFW